MTAEGFTRKLTAMLSTDVTGYNRLMRDVEDTTICTLATHCIAITNLQCCQDDLHVTAKRKGVLQTATLICHDHNDRKTLVLPLNINNISWLYLSGFCCYALPVCLALFLNSYRLNGLGFCVRGYLLTHPN